ncbi:MAG: cyclic nucleotide-binding domain-containing protein [Deltaproteobacteria bacterium]|nr:cyclic nucleotide-binding domain-containing protein [Deltaproteobacteria bacterium]
MGTDEDRGRALRATLEKALEKDKPKDVVASLQGLEKLEPAEPRWPQKLGDYLLRRGNKGEAEVAYLRAFDVLARQGFLPRAVAMAKLIVELNPKRGDLLEKINQDAARALREKPSLSPGLRFPPGVLAPPPARVAATPAKPTPANIPPAPLTPAVIQPAAPPPAAIHTAPPAKASSTSQTLSFAPGAPIPGAVSSAPPLARAQDAEVDEVRFEDLSEDDIVEVDTSDMEAISLSPAKAAHVLAPPDPSAALISKLSATTLFANVAPKTLAALVVAAKRIELKDDELVVKKGDPADAIYVIAEGTARVILPGMRGGSVELAAGQIFGEACLVRRGRRQADVRARGRVVLLRIAVQDLHRIMGDHPELGELLFNLLAGRLVSNLLQTSTLFAAFDMSQRKEIARLFEVRQAPSGTVLQELGKRSDGLYIALMGEFDMEEGGLVATLSAGSIFGHGSLLTRAPADRTIVASSDSVVLRMPASRFASFAAQFPPALEYLAQLSAEPLSMWPSD